MKILLFTFILLCVTQTRAAEFLECCKIMGSFAAITTLYGITNDQITVRICPEYFTKGSHGVQVDSYFPFMKGIKNPTILGCFWGSIYSPFLGVALSIPTILCARLGPEPRLQANELFLPLFCTFFCLLGPITACAGYNAPHYPSAERRKQEFQSLLQSGDIQDPSKEQQWVIVDAAHEALYKHGKWCVPTIVTAYTLYKRFV